ncbi:hypothetical protein IU449_26840 [Nocardia higoensis]|uniref:Uncharacterized protein n=1 Tax=Nocardia higoensis TaxID=228599 RepID=A0ABS0DI26_9NOCA|nr:hypothetical protein [Nocardia higoensis]MBF6358117.1 hypothetical protein [Nocardia higoensis]
MKATELILLLRQAVSEHGNLDVRIYSRAAGGELEIDRVEHNEDDDSPAINVSAED